MRSSLFTLFALSVLAVPSVASAHFLWASLDPATKTVSIGLTEHPHQNPLPLGRREALVKAWTPSMPKLALKSTDDFWLKSKVNDSCVGVSIDYGVIDRGRGVYRLNYYAKAAANAEASQAKLGLPVELTLAKTSQGESVVTVLDNGTPAPGAEVVVERVDGSVAFQAKTGVGGIVVVPPSTGLFAVRGLVTSKSKGTLGGKAYDSVRSYCTLTVPSPGAAPVQGKSLTRKIREAFGQNHEVVGRTAFNQTLMGGRLTKPQLLAHLHQRALVHEAVERVLLYADRTKPVPYGPEQQQVLRLLRSDLEAMGSAWPTPEMAKPLTKRMIAEIEASTKQGPYFALGVMHVYYGGITHGGREIGARIAKKLRVPQTYYLKSDGYYDYAERVNTITNPADQGEMIRGGKAAYKYIIASSDDPVFKSK
ncbi:MAG: hypothetical protein ACO1SV_27770 [Fimbriimonas sp.]